MLSELEMGSFVPYDPDEKDIRGKAIVIIGDVGEFAQAATELLTGYGAPVFLAVKNTAELKAIRASIAQTGGEVDGMVIDLSRPEEVRRFFDQAEDWLGRIDAVINCLPGKGVDAEVRQNLVTQEALLRMRPGGLILNVGSNSGKNSPRFQAARKMADMLRHQAGQSSIRIARVESGVKGWSFDPAETARYVLKSLTQSATMERITRPVHLQIQ